MKPKTKSILALTGTLVIGLVIGSLITAQVIRSRIKDFKDLRHPKNLQEHLMKAARPDAEQEAQIAPLIERFGAEMEALHEETKLKMDASLDLLRDSMDLYLDDDQMRRVNRKLKRLKGRMENGPRPPRPGGPGPHGGKGGRDRPHR